MPAAMNEGKGSIFHWKIWRNLDEYLLRMLDFGLFDITHQEKFESLFEYRHVICV